jgi:autophagy-related protein 18
MLRRTSASGGMWLAAKAAEYLPASVTEMWEPLRDFAWVKVHRPKGQGGGVLGGPSGMRSVVAMSAGHPQLIVVTSEGGFLVYNVDLERGGEGVLERQFS